MRLTVALALNARGACPLLLAVSRRLADTVWISESQRPEVLASRLSLLQ